MSYIDLKQAVTFDDVRREFMIHKLSKFAGDINRIAFESKVSPATIYRWLKRWGINPKGFKKS